MGWRHLVFDWKFYLGCFTPVLLRLKDVNWALGVSGVELNVLTDLLVETGQPDWIGQLGSRDWFELVSTLKLYEPRIHKELTSFVNSPDPHTHVGWTSDEKLDFLYVDHVQDRANVPNNGLEAFICFSVLWFPKFDRTIGTSRNQHWEPIDLRVDQLANAALMSLRRAQFNYIRLCLAWVYQKLTVHVPLLIVADCSIWEANKQ